MQGIRWGIEEMWEKEKKNRTRKKTKARIYSLREIKYNRREKNSKPYTKPSDNNPIISADRPDSILCKKKLINPHSINAGSQTLVRSRIRAFSCGISFAYVRKYGSQVLRAI